MATTVKDEKGNGFDGASLAAGLHPHACGDAEGREACLQGSHSAAFARAAAASGAVAASAPMKRSARGPAMQARMLDIEEYNIACIMVQGVDIKFCGCASTWAAELGRLCRQLVHI